MAYESNPALRSSHQAGYGNIVETWVLMLKSCKPVTIVTVRYVGSTSSPRNPWKRVNKRTERPQSFFGMFLSILRSLFPQGLEQHKVYTIHGSSVSNFGTKTSKPCRVFFNATDHIERYMISFFRFRTLLNRQRGGMHRMLSPSSEEEQVFRLCRTRLLGNTEEWRTSSPQDVVLQVQDLFDSW